MHWINGEIHLLGNAKELLSISRDSFITSQIFDDVSNAFAEVLIKQANNVETIAVAEKELMTITESNSNKIIKSVDQKIEKEIEKLERKGFEVIRDSSLRDEILEIDKKNKRIVVSNLDSLQRKFETVNILNNEYSIVYVDELPDDKPCTLTGNQIEINDSYPLFNSNSHSSLFIRIHLMMLILNEKHPSNNLYNEFLEHIINEFIEYT